MIATLARMAYGNARTRAFRGWLLQAPTADRLREAPTTARRLVVLRGHGIEAASAGESAALLLQRLVAACAALSRAYPFGGDLLLAIGRVHELENLKLALRGLVRRVPRERLARLWQPLGPIATLDRERCLGAASVQELGDALRRTPWVETAPALAQPEAELLLDRFGSLRIAAAARRLPAQETGAIALAFAFVRERDLEAVSRAPAYGLSPQMVRAALALPAHVPDQATEPMLMQARRWRRKLCDRAFMGQPLRLAPAVALLLLLDAQITAAAALVEGGGPPLRALAPSAMGA